MRRAGWAVAIVAFSSLQSGRTTDAAPPASPPAKAAPKPQPRQVDPAEVVKRVDKLVDESLLALHLGDTASGGDLAEEAVRLAKSPGARVQRQLIVRAHTLHATSLLLRGKWVLADRAFTAALAANGSDPPGRELAINRALCEGRFGRFLSAAQVIRKQLEASRDVSPADEELIVVLGSILTADATDGVVNNAATFRDLADLYEKRLAALEKTKPGKRMWGTEWLDAAEVEQMRAQRQRQLDAAAALDGQIRDAEGRMSRAKKQMVENARTERMGLPGHFPNANRDYEAASRDAARARSRRQEALRDIPTPEFPTTYAIALPALPGQSVHRPLYVSPNEGRIRDPLATARAAREAREAANRPKDDPGDDAGANAGRPGGAGQGGAGPGAAARPGAGGQPLFPEPEDEPANDQNPAAGVAQGPAREPEARADVRKDARTFTRRGVAIAVDEHHLLTLHSVVESGSRFTIVVDSSGMAVEASVVMVQPSSNLAMLRAEAPLPASLAVGQGTLRAGPASVLTVPAASLFAPEVKKVPASMTSASDDKTFSISMQSDPRLRGAAVLDRTGAFVTLLTANQPSVDALNRRFPFVDPELVTAFVAETLPGGTKSRGDPLQAAFELSVDVPEP